MENDKNVKMLKTCKKTNYITFYFKSAIYYIAERL